MRFAFELITGKLVAPFAQGFAQWSFANALNYNYGAPYKEFMNLVRFNRADWSEARDGHIGGVPRFRNTIRVRALGSGHW